MTSYYNIPEYPKLVLPNLNLQINSYRYMFGELFTKLCNFLITDEIKAINYLINNVRHTEQVKTIFLSFRKDSIRIWINIDNDDLNLRDLVYDLIAETRDRFNTKRLDFMVFNNLKSTEVEFYTAYDRDAR